LFWHVKILKFKSYGLSVLFSRILAVINGYGILSLDHAFIDIAVKGCRNELNTAKASLVIVGVMNSLLDEPQVGS